MSDSDLSSENTVVTGWVVEVHVTNAHVECCSSQICTASCKLLRCLSRNVSSTELVQTTGQLLLLLKKNAHSHSSLCLSELSICCQHILLKTSMANSKCSKTLVQILAWLKKAHCQQVDDVLNQLLGEIAQNLTDDGTQISAESNASFGFCEDKLRFLHLCCLLCDSIPSARDVWYRHSTEVLPRLCAAICTASENSLWTLSRQHYMHVLVKVTLLTCQCLINAGRIRGPMFTEIGDLDSSGQSKHLLHTCLALLHFDEALPRDCLLITGSIVGLLVSLSTRTLSDLFHNVFDELSNGSEKKPSFGQLCVIQGFLAYADIDKLCEKTQWCGQPSSVLLEMYPLICKMCLASAFKYHSFCLLVLWYRKLLSGQHYIFRSDGQSEVAKTIPATQAKPRIATQSDCQYEFGITAKCSETTKYEDGCSVGREGSSYNVPGTDQSIERTVRLIVSDTWNLLVGHADCNVDGINDSINAILTMLFRIDMKCNKTAAPDCASWLSSSLMTRIDVIPWQSKAKYILLNAVLKYLSCTQVLDRCKHLMDDIYQCMATNFLAPPATLVYQTLLKIICSQSDSLDVWWMHCWPSIYRAVTSHNRLLSQNACQQLLPCTFLLIPTSLQRMLKYLNEESTGQDRMKAIILILSIARSVIGNVPLPLDSIDCFLYGADVDLRSACFKLLCISRRTTDTFSDAELSILKTHLRLNLSSDEAAFRKLFLASIHNAIVRLRDSSLSCLRRNMSPLQRKTVAQAVDFIDWLWTMCVRNLSPGANYQRHDTCLGIIRLILDTFERRLHQTQRKGCIPADADLFLNQGRKNGKLNFFNKSSLYAIFGCIFSSADEIRLMSTDVLILYFPWPLAITDSELSVDGLLASGLWLCNTFKSMHSDIGALICSVVYTRSALTTNISYTIKREDSVVIQIDGSSSHGDHAAEYCRWLLKQTVLDNGADCHFVAQLVDQIETGLDVAIKSVSSAIRNYPIHGFLSAINSCLQRGITSCGTSLSCWRSVVQKLKQLINKLVDFILSLFGGKLESNDAAPSFEHISLAIEDVIQQDDGADALAHERVHSWYWLNLSESAVVLGVLTKTFAALEDLPVLNVADVYDIGKMFVNILTHCRHRGAIEGCSTGLSMYCLKLCINWQGAIEGCSTGFLMYCSSLFNSSLLPLHSLPQKILEDVLHRISSQSASSVTRRSAGLPLIINSLLASEVRCKQTTLLNMLVQHLLEIISMRVSTTELITDQSRDLLEVHALNILSSVVQESNLAVGVSRYYDTLTVHAVDGFISPLWTVRNASLRLLGSLVPKLLGEKKTRSADFNATPSDSFFIRFPLVANYIESVLREAVLNQCSSALNVRLFPVLSILCRLSPSLVPNAELDQLIHSLQSHLMKLSSSTLHSVRCMSGQALAGLVPFSTATQFISSIIISLPVCKADTISFNKLHGMLLQIEYLLISLENSNRLRNSLGHDIIESLTARSWIGSSLHNQCSVVRCVFVKIMSILLNVCVDNDMAAISRTHSFGVAYTDQHPALDTELLTTREYSTDSLSDVAMKSHDIFAQNEAQEEVKMATDEGPTDTSSDGVNDSDDLNLVANIITQHNELVVVKEVKLLLEANVTSHNVLIGEAVWIQNLIECYLSSAADTYQLTIRLGDCLHKGNNDVINAALSFLLKYASSPEFSSSCLSSVQKYLYQFLIRPNTTREILNGTLSLFVRMDQLLNVVNYSAMLETGLLWQRLLTLEDSHQCSYIATMTLRLLSVLVKDQLTALLFNEYVDVWLTLIAKHSNPDMADDMRLSAAECLAITAQSVLHCAATNDQADAAVIDIVLRLLKLLFLLLNDVQPEIRHVTQSIVSNLLQLESTVQSNRASELLLDYVVKSWCKTPIAMMRIYGWLVYADAQHSLDNFTSSRSKLLFEADELNPFLEACLHHKLILCHLQELRMELDLEWLARETEKITFLLQQAAGVLCSFRQQEKLLHCFNKQFYETVSALICRAILLRKWSEKIDRPNHQLAAAFSHLFSLMNCVRPLMINFSTGSFRTLVTLSHLASFIAATFHRFDKLQSKIQNNVANALRTLSAIQTLFHEYYTRTFTDTIPIFTSILSFHYLYQIFAV